MKIHGHQVLISLLIGFMMGFGTGQWQGREAGHRWKGGSMKQKMMEKLNRELQLSEEQKKQVQAVFDAKHPQMVALHDEMSPKFEALRNSTQDEIRKILNPEQQIKFEAFSAKREERWKKRREWIEKN